MHLEGPLGRAIGGGFFIAFDLLFRGAGHAAREVRCGAQSVWCDLLGGGVGLRRRTRCVRVGDGKALGLLLSGDVFLAKTFQLAAKPGVVFFEAFEFGVDLQALFLNRFEEGLASRFDLWNYRDLGLEWLDLAAEGLVLGDEFLCFLTEGGGILGIDFLIGLENLDQFREAFERRLDIGFKLEHFLLGGRFEGFAHLDHPLDIHCLFLNGCQRFGDLIQLHLERLALLQDGPCLWREGWLGRGHGLAESRLGAGTWGRGGRGTAVTTHEKKDRGQGEEGNGIEGFHLFEWPRRAKDLPLATEARTLPGIGRGNNRIVLPVPDGEGTDISSSPRCGSV